MRSAAGKSGRCRQVISSILIHDDAVITNSQPQQLRRTFGNFHGDDVAALPYVAAIVHEALRLCPPSPALGRTATSDVAVDGYRVPAGSLLIYGTAAVQRDPALWDRPDEFDPDRFMGAAAKTHDRWQYAPFGAGPRTCIGDHFAMLEATLALATVLRRIEITSVDDDFPVEFPFTLVAAEPIRAMVHRR